MLASDFDVGFVAAIIVVNVAFESYVEVMAVGCGGFGIVEHGLIGDLNLKDLSQDLGGFSGSNCKRDMKCQHQPEDVG